MFERQIGAINMRIIHEEGGIGFYFFRRVNLVHPSTQSVHYGRAPHLVPELGWSVAGTEVR